MDLHKIFSGVELFYGLTQEELEEVIALCQERKYNEDEIVAKQNKPGNELFIIQQGFVEISIENVKSSRKAIVNLGIGQTIGEMSLIDQGPRSATVRAINTPTVVQVINHADFEALCEKNTRIGYVVMRNMAADLSFRLRQRHLSDL